LGLWDANLFAPGVGIFADNDAFTDLKCFERVGVNNTPRLRGFAARRVEGAPGLSLLRLMPEEAG